MLLQNAACDTSPSREIVRTHGLIGSPVPMMYHYVDTSRATLLFLLAFSSIFFLHLFRICLLGNFAGHVPLFSIKKKIINRNERI